MNESELDHFAVKLGCCLNKQKLTLSVAESCTGGLIGHQITNIPGSSDYFRGGIIAYADRIKEQILGVPGTVIKQPGAVSRPTVEQMVRQVASLFNTQCAVAVSGIAGPGGGTPAKPVGLAWIAVLSPGGITAQEFHFSGNRKQIKNQAACAAFNMLLSELA